MDVRINRSSTRTTITAEGDLDQGGAPELLTKLMPLFDDGAPPVVADLEEVEFVDSSGLGALLWAKRRADYTGTQFTIAPSEVLSRRLAQSGLDRQLSLVGAGTPVGDEHPSSN